MGKSTPSPPPAPDYAGAAAAQGAANRETAVTQGEMNMINQRSPWGSLTFNALEDSPAGNPRYEAVQDLSEAQQQILAGNEQLDIGMLDTANQQLGRVTDALGQPINIRGGSGGGDVSSPGFGPGDYAPWPGGTAAGGGVTPPQVTNIDPNIMERQRVEEALMGRLDPYLERDRAALETRLANQGIGMGSEAWNRGMDDFNRSSTDARLATIGAAGGEQSRLFEMDAANAALQNAGRQQSIQELMLERQTPINEIIALMSGAQVQQPQFVPTPQTNISAPDIMGAQYASYAGEQQNYRAQLAAQQANTQGLYGLLGTGLGAGGYFFGNKGF